ncbi:MAG TPA: polyprenyl diphosphate synthase [Candidatus Moranbacteria bacterium]|nr:polyprenyl diphosphate synthase [Candidatus Moranbacteria bacterium]
MNIPNHIAIIPDGNRRWARERGLEPWRGHEAGAENIEKLVRFALDKGVKCVSFWGSSLENLAKRPLAETRALLRIYEEYFTRLLENEDIHKNETKIHVIGRWREQFPAKLKAILEEGIAKTAKYAKRDLVFFLAYSGTDEMLEAVRNIVRSGVGTEEVNAETVKENLWTRELPPVDLLVRTGGEPHLSAGFMMWDISDAQLYFSARYFPDFGTDELARAIDDYGERGKRKGA